MSEYKYFTFDRRVEGRDQLVSPFGCYPCIGSVLPHDSHNEWTMFDLFDLCQVGHAVNAVKIDRQNMMFYRSGHVPLTLPRD